MKKQCTGGPQLPSTTWLVGDRLAGLSLVPRAAPKPSHLCKRHAARVARANVFARAVLQQPRKSFRLPTPPNVALDAVPKRNEGMI